VDVGTEESCGKESRSRQLSCVEPDAYFTSWLLLKPIMEEADVDVGMRESCANEHRSKKLELCRARRVFLAVTSAQTNNGSSVEKVPNGVDVDVAMRGCCG
jgi:hypothetical protein